MTTNRRLVLVVDTDPGFTEATRRLLKDERVLVATSVGEAAEVLVGEQVDLALLGPSLGTERGVTSAGLLREVDPALTAVLVTGIVTNRILLAALRSGLVDVVDTPLTEKKLKGILDRLPGERGPDDTVILEPGAARGRPLEFGGTAFGITGTWTLASPVEVWSSLSTPVSFVEDPSDEVSAAAPAADPAPPEHPLPPSADDPGAIPIRSVDFIVETGGESVEGEDDLPSLGWG
jgi:CheY-like chemotaxis protein